MAQLNFHILVVDDNAVNRLLLRRNLEQESYRVTEAESGEEALEKLSQNHFDLMLLDIVMPEMSGLEVLEQVRKQFDQNTLPVIMATSVDESKDMVSALNLGANDYITKPFDYSVLSARVKTQLNLKQTNDRNLELLEKLRTRNSFIREVFGRFVSDEIVEQLLKEPKALALGGEQKSISILFADIRNFTQISERLTPAQVVNFLNNYLGTITDIISEHGGTVNEFYGDGVLAFFGAPVTNLHHEEASIRCAIAMQQAIPNINLMNSKQNLPEVMIGVAINSGEVVVGNIGSEKHCKYGVVGMPVNIAARIEKKCQGGEILVAESTYKKVSSMFAFGDKNEVTVKGVSNPLTVYKLIF